MEGVLSPFVVNSFYWDCDPDGHTEYVASKDPLPVDERTPAIKRMVFKQIEAHNCYVCGAFIYGLPEAKIEEIMMEDIVIDYCKNPIPEYPAMMAGVDKTTKMGIYINNVRHLVMNRIKITGQEGPAWSVYHVDEFIRDGQRMREGENASDE